MFLNSSSEILDAMKLLSRSEGNYDGLLKQAKVIGSQWKQTTQSDKAQIIRTLLSRVIVHDSALEILLDLEATLQILSGKQVAGTGDSRERRKHSDLSLASSVSQ